MKAKAPKRGRIDEIGLAALRGMRRGLDEIFATNLALKAQSSASNVRGNGRARERERETINAAVLVLESGCTAKISITAKLKPVCQPIPTFPLLELVLL